MKTERRKWKNDASPELYDIAVGFTPGKREKKKKKNVENDRE